MMIRGRCGVNVFDLICYESLDRGVPLIPRRGQVQWTGPVCDRRRDCGVAGRKTAGAAILRLSVWSRYLCGDEIVGANASKHARFLQTASCDCLAVFFL